MYRFPDSWVISSRRSHQEFGSDFGIDHLLELFFYCSLWLEIANLLIKVKNFPQTV